MTPHPFRISRLAAIALCIAAAHAHAATDPTVATDAMADVLRQRLTEANDMRMHALVVGSSGEGVALIGPDSTQATAVRRGSRLTQTVDGVKVDVSIKSVTPLGVELATSRGDSGLFLPGSFTPLEMPADPPQEMLRYIESEKVAISDLMRLVADQTGANISVSDDAAHKAVSIFLRNVTVDAAVEEICRATGLWFRREPNGSVIRIMTMGLYPDRTLISLGEEEFDEDDEYDLSRRFRRFRVLNDNGGSQFMSSMASQVSSSGSRSGGNFSFSRGGATSRLTQWDQLRQRNRSRNRLGGDQIPLGADDARLMEGAYHDGNTNLLDSVRAQATTATANIFVSLSRKNNMLVVRTSDVRVMDEIRGLVKKLDVPTPMVLMEVKVLEIDVTDDFTAEFSYSFNRADKAYNAVNSEGRPAHNTLAGFPGFDPVANNPVVASSMSFQIVSDKIAARIQLLQRDGKVKTLATPTLLTANNEVSRIFSGVEYPIVTSWSKSETIITETTVVKSEASANVEIKDVGTMLLITPNINADKTVTLRLLQENSSVGIDKARIPVDGDSGNTREVEFVESRSLVGTFVAKDDTTVLAGGLIKETEEETYSRTPVLGSIPLIGWLFRGTKKVKHRTELVVLIKPHVILTPIEGGKISSELMKALSAHPAADGRDTMGVHNPDKPHDPSDDVRNIIK